MLLQSKWKSKLRSKKDVCTAKSSKERVLCMLPAKKILDTKLGKDSFYLFVKYIYV